jgi:hypothetical protein
VFTLFAVPVFYTLIGGRTKRAGIPGQVDHQDGRSEIPLMARVAQ